MKKNLLAGVAALFFIPVFMYAQQGTLDNTFGTGGKLIQNIGFASFEVTAMGIQTDGKIILAGSADNTTTSFDFILARFNTNGTLDNTFDGDGIVVTDIQANGNDQLVAMTILTGGKILVAGTGTANVLVRYNSNGSPDNTFGVNGKLIIDNPSDFSMADMLVQTDNKIVLTGSGGFPSKYIVVRMSSEGVLDNTFDTDGIAELNFTSEDYYPSAIAIQTDGKLLVTGTLNDFFNGIQSAVTARVTTTGALDNTFGTSGRVVTEAGSERDEVSDIAIQSDGSVLVSGYGTDDGGGLNYTFLIRYTSAGVPDNTFDGDGIVSINTSTTFFSLGNLLLVTGNKIMLTGIVKNPSGIYSFALARFNTNGSFDNTFGTNGIAATAAPANSQLGTLLLQQGDGKLVTGGFLSNGVNFQAAVYRTLSNGSPDAGFDGDGIAVLTMGNAAGSDEGKSLVIPSGDKLIAGGSYSNGIDRGSFLYRTNSDGSVDNTFGTAGKVFVSSSFSSDINSIVLQPDGKIITIGSFFDVFNGTDVVLSRFNSNGTIDNSFGTNGKTIFAVDSKTFDNGLSVALQSDGKIIVYVIKEDFTTFTTTQYLYRFTTGGIADNTFGTAGRTQVNLVFNNTGNYNQRIAIQTDNKILVTGSVQETGSLNFGLIRYTANGLTDNSFNSGNPVSTDFNGFDDDAYTTTLQSDGKIVVAGRSLQAGGLKLGIARYNTNGTLDNSFDTDGKAVISTVVEAVGNVSAVVVQADLKILLAGTSFDVLFNSNMFVARLTAGGVLDNTFGTTGVSLIPFTSDNLDVADALALQSTGKIILSGKISANFQEDLAIFRLNNTIATGINNRYTELKNIQVAPNPVRSQLLISSSNLNNGKYNISIRTVDGKLVRSETITVNGRSMQLYLPAQDWPAGVLMVEVSGNQQTKTFRVVKMAD